MPAPETTVMTRVMFSRTGAQLADLGARGAEDLVIGGARKKCAVVIEVGTVVSVKRFFPPAGPEKWRAIVHSQSGTARPTALAFHLYSSNPSRGRSPCRTRA